MFWSGSGSSSRERPTVALTAALFLALLLAACETRTGPEFDSQLQVILQSDGTSPALLGGLAIVDVPPELVGGLGLQFSRVEALPSGASEGDPQAWRSLDVVRGELNLLALPGGGIELAAGGFPPGSYSQMRLFIPGGSLTLTDPLPTNPDALPPGTYPASVPAAADFGVDVQGAGFQVPEQGQVTVVVVADLEETLANIEWTGEFFLVRPVFRPAN